MLILLSILLATAMVALAVILLAPFRVKACLNGPEWAIGVTYLGAGITLGEPKGYWIVSFLGWRIRSGVFGKKEPKKSAPPKPKEKRPEKEPKKLGEWLGLIQSNDQTLRRTLLIFMRLLGRLLRAWRIEDGQVTITAGTGNPAYTGMLTGSFHALRGALASRWPNLACELNPDFNRAVLDMNARVTLRIIPLGPVADVVRTLASLPWRGLWRLKRAWVS